MKYVMPAFLKKFKCLEEGYCCHRWNISVNPKELEMILSNLKTVPEQDLPPGCGFETIRGEDGKVKDVYTKTCENRCSFLVDKKCFLHSKFGLEGKPIICQSYPFYALKTPNIAYINASMACPCTLQILKEKNDFTLVNPSKSIGNQFSLKANVCNFRAVQLSQKSSTNWQGFYHIHKKLLRHHRDADYLTYIWNFFRDTKQEYFTIEQIQNVCENPTNKEAFNKERHLYYALLGWQFWYQQNMDDDEVSPVISYFVSYLGITDIEKIPPLAVEKYFSIYQQNFSDKDVAEIMENYLFILLFSSEFYFTHDLVQALTRIKLATALTIFCALAKLGDSQGKISVDDVLDAVYVIEKFFFHSDYFTEIKTLAASPYVLTPQC